MLDISLCVQITNVDKCVHVVDWLSAHVNPLDETGGFVWWKGLGWTYEFDLFGPGPHIHLVTFDDHVDEDLIMQFVLTWS